MNVVYKRVIVTVIDILILNEDTDNDIKCAESSSRDKTGISVLTTIMFISLDAYCVPTNQSMLLVKLYSWFIC